MRPREFDTQVYRMLNMEQEFEYTVTGNFDIRGRQSLVFGHLQLGI